MPQLDMPLWVAWTGVFATVVTWAVVYWLYSDSSRHDDEALWYKALAVTFVVLALPGPLAAFVPAFADQLDPSEIALFAYLGLVAGGLSAILCAAYVVRHQRPRQAPYRCPSCRAEVRDEWDTCPYCRASLRGGWDEGSTDGTRRNHGAENDDAGRTRQDDGQRDNRSGNDPWSSIRPGQSVDGDAGGHEVGDDPPTVLKAGDATDMLAWLAVTKGPHAGRFWRLGSETRIGRGIVAKCEIVLDDATVSSGHHALIRRQDDGFMLADLASLNGTWVNGEQTLRHVLRDKDRIVLGETHLVYVRIGEPRDIDPDGPRAADAESSTGGEIT